ncbi:MAG TPA: carboxymuconolactone decarboxylase family protein [Thermoanaerobaculia bacterium]|nr:carboxymuconolactone decarboxylase family protein [Thermoanaerobaculia bacterium]
MEARMTQPAILFPDAMKAMHALHGTVEKSGLPASTIRLVEVRASQMNGCSVCVDMHAREMKQDGESDERLFTVAAWRDAPYFTDAERAALALTEELTVLDRTGVSDEVWNEARRYYDERELAGLVIAIANINVWNRLNIPTRQVAGEWIKRQAAAR